MNFDTIFLSDIHKGHPTFDSEAFSKFLSKVEYRQAYIIGDSTEPFVKSPPDIKNAFYLEGNHDFDRQWINFECQDTGKLYLYHGHKFDPILDYPPKKSSKYLYYITYALSYLFLTDFSGLLRRFNFYLGKLLGRYEAIPYVEFIHKKIADYCSGKNLDIWIGGHTHIPGIYRYSGVTLLDLGCWLENSHREYYFAGSYSNSNTLYFCKYSYLTDSITILKEINS